MPNTVAAQPNRMFEGTFQSQGYIMWFHVPDVDYSPVDLAMSASRVGLMPDLGVKVKARGGSNAWEVATNLKDVYSANGAKNITRQYVTEDIPGLTWTRVLLLITKDKRNVEIGSMQVAALRYTNNALQIGFHKDFTVETVGEPIFNEASSVINQVRDEMSNLINSMSAAGVRYLVRSWLMKNHRVPLKNNGGAYFIPIPKDPAMHEELQNQLVTLINWITAPPIMGEFVVIPLVPTESVFSSMTIGQVQSAAFQSLEDEANDLRGMLRDYQNRGREGKQIRPSSMIDIRSSLDRYVEKAELLSDQLDLQTGKLVASVDILRAQFEKVWKDHGSNSGMFTRDVNIFTMSDSERSQLQLQDNEQKELRAGTKKNRKIEGK